MLIKTFLGPLVLTTTNCVDTRHFNECIAGVRGARLACLCIYFHRERGQQRYRRDLNGAIWLGSTLLCVAASPRRSGLHPARRSHQRPLLDIGLTKCTHSIQERRTRGGEIWVTHKGSLLGGKQGTIGSPRPERKFTANISYLCSASLFSKLSQEQV